MKKQQSGFGHVVILMAVVIVILLGVISWLAWNQMQMASSKQDTSTTAKTTTTTDTNTSTSSNNSSTTPTTTKTTTQSTSTTPATPSISGTDAENLVTEFYGKYAVFGSDREGLIKQYGTATLLSDWNNAAGADPIECAQDVPSSVTVTGHAANGSKMNVTVNETFGDTTDTLTVSVVSQSGLKIDHVTCPQR